MVNKFPQPLGNKVLIQPEKKEEKTQNGLIIPIVVNKDIEEGIVMAASPDVIHIEIGDKILYPAGAGINVTIDNENYKFICGPVKDSPGDIIAIINNLDNEIYNDLRMP